jgi:aminobenzoyl-glutamate transport protein
MENAPEKPKKGFLYLVEKGGNALPHPAILFGLLAVTVLVISAIASLLGWSGIHPATGVEETANNMLSRAGIRDILQNMVTNYTSFAPLGVVMVALLGIGVAEQSGLIKAAVNSMLVKTPEKMITFTVIFVGIISSIGSDMGYVLVIPLAGVIFHSLGRNPLVGMAAAFAGVSAGFSANIIVTPLDPMLAGITTEAARIFDPYYPEVSALANYFFLIAATVVLSIVGVFVTTRWVEPRMGKYTGDTPQEEITRPTDIERKALGRAGYVLLGWLVLLLAGFFLPWGNGFLLGFNAATGETFEGVDGVLRSPVLRGIITILFLMAATAGAVFGYTTGKYKAPGDVIGSMNESFKTLAAYLVLVFFCAQFVAWFRDSNLGILLAIGGADALNNVGLNRAIPLILVFTIFTAVLNIFIGSASAKWALLAPVYIPIFMSMGFTPEFAQAVYHAGDNATNIITPLLPYFALIIVYYQKYDKNAGIGTIMGNMIPYSITFFIAWVGLLVGFYLLGLPLGPGVSYYFEMTAATGGM